MHFYQHHIGDFIKATSRLTDSQSMAYLRMIWIYYDTESPLNNDVDAIAFEIGANASDVNQILKRFFFLHDDGKWHHSRCDKEILAFLKKSESARKSANARWENANVMRTHIERNTNEPICDATHNPLPITQENNTGNPVEPANASSCPHAEIVKLYHELLPELTSIRDLTPKRQTALRARWKSHKRFQCLSWWRDYFLTVKDSDFLMGRLPGKTWQADFDFLIRAEKFQKIIEGGYQNAD